MKRLDRESYFLKIAQAISKAPDSTGNGIIAVKDRAIVATGYSSSDVTALASLVRNMLAEGRSAVGCVFYTNYVLEESELKLAKSLMII